MTPVQYLGVGHGGWNEVEGADGCNEVGTNLTGFPECTAMGSKYLGARCIQSRGTQHDFACDRCSVKWRSPYASLIIYCKISMLQTT